jgi:hypothetical protein
VLPDIDEALGDLAVDESRFISVRARTEPESSSRVLSARPISTT